MVKESNQLRGGSQRGHQILMILFRVSSISRDLPRLFARYTDLSAISNLAEGHKCHFLPVWPILAQGFPYYWTGETTFFPGSKKLYYNAARSFINFKFKFIHSFQVFARSTRACVLHFSITLATFSRYLPNTF